jgi:hypothetical protein
MLTMDFDRLIIAFDKGLRTVFAPAQTLLMYRLTNVSGWRSPP